MAEKPQKQQKHSLLPLLLLLLVISVISVYYTLHKQRLQDTPEKIAQSQEIQKRVQDSQVEGVGHDADSADIEKGSLLFGFPEGVEIRVTDNQGRTSGITSAGDVVNEIPFSEVADSAELVLLDGDKTSQVTWLNLYASGIVEYSVEIPDLTPSESIVVYAKGLNGALITETIDTTFLQERGSSFSMTFDPTADVAFITY